MEANSQDNNQRGLSFSDVKASRTFRVSILTLSRVITMGVQFLIVAILARVLSSDEYAIYFQAILVYNTLSPILAFGFPNTIYVLLPQAKEVNKERSVVVVNQVVLLSITILFSIFVFLGGNRLIAEAFNNPLLVQPVKYIALYMIAMVPLQSLEGVMLVSHRTIRLVAFRVVTRVLTVFGIVLPALLLKNASGALLGLSIVSLLSYFVGLFFMLEATKSGDWVPEKSLVKSQFMLALPLFVAVTFGALQSNLDKLIIAILDKPENYLTFAVGATQIPFINLFITSITEVILADSSKLFAEKRLDKVANLVWRMFSTNMLILTPLMLFFWAVAENFIQFVYTDTYTTSVIVFQLYLLLIPARFITFSSFEIASGKTYIVPTVFTANTILTIVATVLMYPKYGYLSAVYAYLGVTYLFAIPAHFLFYKFALKLPLFKTIPIKDLLKNLVVIGISGLVLLLKKFLPEGDLLRIILLAGIYGVSVVGCYFLFRVNLPLVGPLLNQFRMRFLEQNSGDKT